MTLRLPAFEKALRRRVRAEVRKSRVLRRQARRARRRWWLNPAWLAFGYGAFLIGALVTKIAPAGHEFAARMAVVCLWFLGTLATNSAALAATLGDGARNWCLQLLPLRDAEVFRIQWRQHVRSSSWWLLFYAPFAVSLVAPRITDWRLLLAGVGLVLLQALCARAIVVHLAAWGLTGRVGAFGFCFPLAIGLGFLAASRYGAGLGDLYAALNWVPVFGWLNQVFLHAVVGGSALAWLWLIPVLLLFGALPVSWRRLRDGYVLAEPVFRPTAQQGDEADGNGAPVVVEDGHDVPGDSKAGEASVRSREFLRGEAWWTAGWYERMAGRLLSARQRLLAEFLLAAAPNWSAGHRRGLRRWGLVMLFVAGFGAHGAWVLMPALLFTLDLVVPFAGGNWPGLQFARAGDFETTPWALQPVGHREIEVTLRKLNLLRFLTGLPLLAGLALVAGWRCPQFTPAQAMLGLVRLSGIVLACLPLFGLLQLSSATDDSLQVRWRRLPGLLVFILMVIGFGIGAFLASRWVVVLACLAVLAVISWWLAWSQARAWSRGRFDMVKRG